MNFKAFNKHMLKRKIKSFTIVELIVAMLVSGIAVSISILGYEMIQRTLKNSNELYQFESESLLLATALENDFDRANYIIEVGKKIKIKAKEHPMVIYDISQKENILRICQSRVDTFQINVSDVFITRLNQTRYVKSLRFNVGVNEYRHTLYINKDYPFQFLFELENNNEY